jgi:hypothetical protein
MDISELQNSRPPPLEMQDFPKRRQITARADAGRGDTTAVTGASTTLYHLIAAHG